MRLQFDGNQIHQLRAIESVADLLRGQPRRVVDSAAGDLGSMFGPICNRLDIDEPQLLNNLHAVQVGNGIQPDAALQAIEDTIPTSAGEQQIRFFNFSVEMETGTGKTYAYIRTALELNRRYGLRKFIVVVPSVAVREGVIKSLKITQDHLRALYDNVPYRYTVYDSRSIAKVRQFAHSDCVELLVMTIDSFNKEDNVIRQSTDRLQGATPLFLVQSARPVLILDEPQNMESEGRIRALASLNPLFALRYSATHRNPYNLVYRLTPFEAYRQALVKKIEVASVVKEDDFNQVFVRVDEIRTAAKTVQAKIAVHQRMAGAAIKEKAYLFKPGNCLQTKAGRPEYASFVIDEINAADQVVRFKNGIEIAVGQTQGANQAALFREQIRYAVEEHFRKQKRLKDAGIKVLSLFFIDRVENFAGATPVGAAGSIDGLYPGIIREQFDHAFDELKAKYPDFADKKASEVRAHYFAQKNRRGGMTELLDSTTGQSAEDRAAYNLIMKDKERLLSFDEPVAFIFSHSALREGWDNPNVCQICTLNQSVSEVKKRQEVGRGMRLVVNQQGQRVAEDKMNVLTVVANESYELFVATLQTEMEEAFGTDGAAPKPVNARQKRVAKRKALDNLPADFIELWNRIRLKTRYQVAVNSDKLIADVVAALDKLKIDPPRIVASKAEIKADAKQDRLDYVHFGQKVVATLTGGNATPNLGEMIADLIAHITPPIKLTRRTLAKIITTTTNRKAALDNPQDFALQAARIVREKAVQQLVDGIQYFTDGTWYEMTEWVEEEETVSDRLIPVDNSIYDHIVVQSDTEKRFVEKLKKRTDVRLFAKLPNWFKVATPVGQYNPDWGLVMEEVDQFGEQGPVLYLVRETKSTTVPDELRGTENQKIHCGKRHFEGALGVDYCVVTSADDLPWPKGKRPNHE
ncbi:MAG TPA: DEAD/DEAH box helicase family protein [Tepidisphaeraceae bacterium]|jgi:type III restriction enzyme|nr:DEAD/DEAH box helicase family protein [Tepidisphaeraceae bacterium]